MQEEKGGWVYIRASYPNGTLYVGVTNNLAKRGDEHETGNSQFTRRYNCHMLVWYEFFPDITAAIAREKQIKNWPRYFKIRLIKKTNPTWQNLTETLNA